MKKYIIGPKMDKNGVFAGNKFPRDIIEICKNMGYIPVYINEWYSKRKPWELIRDFFHLLKIKSNSEVVYIDQVYLHTSRNMILSILNKKNVSVISLLEDVEPIRNETISDIDGQRAIDTLNNTKCIISQNFKMTEYLKKHGVKVDIVNLEVLDFLAPEIKKAKYKKQSVSTICYGGNLTASQSGFLHKLKIKKNELLQFYVYGAGEEQTNLPDHVFYKGVFSAEDSIKSLKGDWGLVWNGESLEFDSNDKRSVYYNYVCPHKFSMYALCGIPPIVYSGSAMAKFVSENNCGITIDNLNEIPTKVDSVSLSKYLQYRHNILNIAQKMANGNYTKLAIKKAEKIIKKDR